MQPDSNARKEWIGLLAKSPADRVRRLWEGLGREPAFSWLRRPETGSVMVRGRAGATGAPFNLGEMTVTRCSLRLGSGAVGHGYCQGRDSRHARIAAIVDAMMQDGDDGSLERSVLGPLRQEDAQDLQSLAAKAEATKVDFFTLVRGEDE